MSVIVLKFGGTSLKSPKGLGFLVSHVKNALKDNYRPIVVVSAMGRKGEPYATDTLINELERVGNPIDPKKKDLIMSCGEIISAAIVSHLLDGEGISSEALTGYQAGILTNSEFTDSKIVNINTFKLSNIIKEEKVAVVAGFQGANYDGEITTLGRGGSDITAVALGGYLKAESVQIFTDVAGVAVIDPKIIPDTIFLDRISYDNMHSLSSNGARVIHPRAVSLAKEFNIPVHVRSNFSFRKGTIIQEEKKDISNKIIGITLDSGEEGMKISLFYQDPYLMYLIPHINSLIVENNLDSAHISKETNRIDFITSIDKGEELAKQLYSYFFRNKK